MFKGKSVPIGFHTRMEKCQVYMTIKSYDDVLILSTRDCSKLANANVKCLNEVTNALQTIDTYAINFEKVFEAVLTSIETEEG